MTTDQYPDAMPMVGTDNPHQLGWFVPGGGDKPTDDALEVWGDVLSEPTPYATRHGFRELPPTGNWPNPRWFAVEGQEALFWEDHAYVPRGGDWVFSTSWHVYNRSRTARLVGILYEGYASRYPLRHVLWFVWHHRRLWMRGRASARRATVPA